MPSASQETLDTWQQLSGFTCHESLFQEAEITLRKHFNCNAGWFTEKSPDYEMTDKEAAALAYLCEEWDYAYGSPD